MCLRLPLFLATLLLLGALAGCATLSKAQCEVGDWRAIGQSDGQRGMPISQFDEHVSACAEHGISVNRELYEAGRATGLVNYCRMEVAQADGLAGRRYYGVCSGERGESFARVHAAANNVHAAEQEIELAQGQLDNLIARLSQPDITPAEKELVSSDITYQQAHMTLLATKRKTQEAELRRVLASETDRLARLDL